MTREKGKTMKASAVLFSLLVASQVAPGLIHSVSAQTVGDVTVQSDDYVDSMQLKFAYRHAVAKAKLSMPAYSYDEVTDRIETLRDGNQLKSSKTAGYARDGSGRMRIATATLRGAERIVYVDPAAGTAYMVRPERKDVLRMRGGDLAEQPRTAADPEPLPDYYKAAVHTQLGVKEVAGIQARGMSSVTTIPAGTVGNDKDLVDTSESWYARDLGEFVYRHRVSARYGELTMHVENLKVGDVPAVVFAVPDGYQVRDVVVAKTLAQQ